MTPDAHAPDPNAVWERALAGLRGAVPESTFSLWFEPVRALSIGGRVLYLSVPKQRREWIARRYGDAIARAVRAAAPEVERVEIVRPRAADDPAADADVPAVQPLAVDAGHTFERFVISPANRLAHSAALAVAELPGDGYNPLFLHGPPGLGKTHLLGAIANYMRRRHPALNVHYTTAERFVGEFVSAMRSSGPSRFKERYRGLDALLIDDVQVLEGKERTAEEFVHTFNALHGAGKQIVLSSDRPPVALAGLADRLRDRFEWGLCVGLGPPDLRSRTVLLWRMAGQEDRPPPDVDALRDIAGRVPGNVRRLEGAMTRVAAYSSLLDEPISQALVERALTEAPRTAKPALGQDRELAIATIQDAVCSVFELSRADLLSPSRTARVARARQLAMYLARELTTLSLKAIAREFDRDHTTVLHAIRSVNERLEPGDEMSTALQRIRSVLHRDEPPTPEPD